jgi:CDP-4-dehydro-6-deoxyglucose reductase
MLETRKRARIVAARTLSPSVRSLFLAFPEGPLSFAAGQWLNLYVPTPDGLQKRAYSIASAPHEPQVELAITLVADGAASPSLHALDVGSELEVDGPHGFFTRDAQSAHVPSLYVATGTGLSPLRSMLLAALHEGTFSPTTLLFGCRTQDDILWGEQLTALREAVPELRVEVTLSRPAPSWQGRTGYVQAHVVELARALGEPHVYICGLNHMVSSVRGLCKSQLSYDRKRIHSERYD